MKKMILPICLCLAGCFEGMPQELASCEIQLAQLTREPITNTDHSKFIENCMAVKGYNFKATDNDCIGFHMSGVITSYCFSGKLTSSMDNLRDTFNELFKK